MYSETVCRLCLSIDAPVRDISDSSLQELFEKLTKVPLKTSDKPVVACLLCHSQLMKCHKLMTRALTVDQLLNKILHTGALITRELIEMIDYKKYRLNDVLSKSPIELHSYRQPEHGLEEEPDNEHLICENVEEIREPTMSVDDIKVENQVEIEFIAIDGNDIKHKGLTGGGVIHGEDVGIGNGRAMDTDEMYLEQFRDTDEELFEGAPDVNCERPTLAGTRDTTTRAQNTTTRPTHREETRSSDSSAYSERNAMKVQNRLESTSRYVTVASKDGVKDKYLTAKYIRNMRHFKHLNADRSDMKMSKERTFECAICRKSFKLETNFKRHLSIHSNEKLLQCDICQSNFNDSCQLMKHLRTHSGEKALHCAICGERFSHKSNLKSHLRIHSQEKLFQCEITPRSFNRSNVIRSFKIYSGEKSFECAICEKRFIYETNLKRHLRRHVRETFTKGDI